MTYLILDHDTIDRLLTILAHEYANAQNGDFCTACNRPQHGDGDECDLRVILHMLHELHDDAFGEHDTLAQHESFSEGARA